MKRTVYLFGFLLSVFVLSMVAEAGTINVSLDPADWIEYGTLTSSRSKSTVGGYLRFQCNTRRGYIGYRTADTYDMRGATVRYKWRMAATAGYDYAWCNDGTNAGIGFGHYFNIHHVWSVGILVNRNTWIYTELTYNDDLTYSYSYGYSGYGDGGILSGGGVLSQATFDALENGWIVKRGGDNYTTPFWFEFAEVQIITQSQPLTVDITSPATQSYYQPGETVSLVSATTGGDAPFSYEWSSNVDGVLGSGETLDVSTLSTGAHTITVTCTDNNADVATDFITVNIIEAPVISEIPDEVISDAIHYYAPVPVVNSGAGAVTWTYTPGHPTMQFSSSNGRVSWWTPIARSTPYTITIRATNAVGFDTETWTLQVNAKPDIAEIADHSVMEAQDYTSPVPTLNKGDNVTWSLINKPNGATIDPATGQVTWLNAIASSYPYFFEIRATNSAGYDEEEWLLYVESEPEITPVSDKTVREGNNLSFNVYLEKGYPAVTWSLEGAPAGMAINSNGYVTLTNASPAGVYNVTIKAQNVHGEDTEPFELKIVAPPEIADLADESITEGMVYTRTATVTKGTDITWSLLLSPSGMTIDSTTGVITWNSVSGLNSPYTVIVRASNSAGYDDETYILTVASPPMIVNINNDSVAEGTVYTGPAPGLHMGTAPITWSIDTAPAGSTIDPATGVITIPGQAYTGTDVDVVIRADNSLGYDTEAWTLEVIQTPVISGANNATIPSAMAFTSGAPALSQGAGITWSLVSGPSGLTIDPSTGVASWTNPVSTGSPFDIIIQASNIAGTDKFTWTLTVLDEPVIADITDVSIDETQSYISVTPTLTQGALPVTWSLVEGPSGMTIDPASGVVSWPNPTAAVTPYTVKIKAENQVGFDEESWLVDVAVGYTAMISTDVDVDLAGTPVSLTGNAFWYGSGAPAANMPVKIAVKVKGMTRLINTTSDAAGDINTVFTPVLGEAGLYEISAGHPIEDVSAAHDQFILVGINANPDDAVYTMFPGDTVTGTFKIKNLGDTPLTGMNYYVKGPSSIDVQLTLDPDLAASENKTVSYTVTALDASVANADIEVELTSSEGAYDVFDLDINVKPLFPQLAVSPTSLQAGMVRGQTTTVQLAISNIGGAPTPELTVLIPNAPWLSMDTPEVIGVHDPNETTVVTLMLSPEDTAQLGQYTGSVLVYGDGMSKTVPFEFNCVSDAIGGLTVSAVDEYTYYGAGAPKVDNAKLSLKDLITGQVHYYNEPMPDGELVMDNLPESYYELVVKAPEHDIYKNTVVVVPGVNTPVTAFMARQLVTYTWTVIPTQIPDVYTVSLTQTYKTNVPAPVVVIEPGSLKMSDVTNSPNGEMQVDFTVTNHGLVAAEDFYLEFDDHPQIEVELLTDFQGRIDPGATVVIPALIRDKQYGNPDALMDYNDCDPAKGRGYYTLVCGDDGKWKRVEVPIINDLCRLTNWVGSLLGGGSSNYNPTDNPPAPPSDPDGFQWPSAGGTSPSGGGALSVGPPSRPSGFGNTKQRPHTPRVTIVLPGGPGGGGGGGCDPCPQKIVDAIGNCILAFVPGCYFQFYLNTENCLLGCAQNGLFSEACYIGCGHGFISILTSCAVDATGFGIAWNILGCLYGLATACQTNDMLAYENYAMELEELTGGMLDIPPAMPDGDDAMANLQLQISRLTTMMEAATEFFGDPAWFSGELDETGDLNAILSKFADAVDPAGDMGGEITAAERSQMLSLPAPSVLTADVINNTCDRWNRTLNYYRSGKFSTADLDPGDDPDFVDMDVLRQKWIAAADVAEELEAEGHTTIMGPVQEAAEDLEIALNGENEGVCAKVKIEIDQRAVVSRSAFRANLTLTNDSQLDALEGVTVNIEITDIDGNPANSLFGISSPVVTGLPDINGGGDLNPGQSMEAEWLLIPTYEAAPLSDKEYLVGGEIAYEIDGSFISIPLMPDVITVMPDPKLHMKYFFETDVYSDDPFTPEIEPAIPFALGLMIENKGAGTAYDFSITSALPEIIRHEQDKDIIISFDLIGTLIGDAPATPALELTIGNIEPNDVIVAQWLMTTSLQGEFVDYNATFAHIDPIGDPRLSLIESVSSHEMVHVVQADCPEDDGIDDFLTNDVPDVNGIADTVHLSSGGVEPVEAMIGPSSWISGSLSDTNLSVTLSTQYKPSGFVYIRVPNPGDTTYALASVMRSDGKVIKVTENAWTTHKTIHEVGQAPYEQNYLHIFDCDGDGTYTLTFTKVGDAEPEIYEVVIDDITTDIGADHLFTVGYTDDSAINVSSLDSFDIQVVGPHGYAQYADFVDVDAAGDGTPRTATYSIPAPGADWDSADNGLYQLHMQYQQVSDDGGNYVQSGVIGGFSVNFPTDCNNLEVISYNILAQRRVSRTVFDFDYSVTLKNHCSNPVSNLRFIPTSLPAGMTLIYDNVTFDNLGSYETRIGDGFFTVRMDYQLAQGIASLDYDIVKDTVGDFSGDGHVGITDLRMLCESWLQDDPAINIMPPDNIIDLRDFEAFANDWIGN